MRAALRRPSRFFAVILLMGVLGMADQCSELANNMGVNLNPSGAPRHPTPSVFFKGVVGSYSYSNNSTQCLGTEYIVDPITLVVRGRIEDLGDWTPVSVDSWVVQHLGEHGLDNGDEGVQEQYFRQANGYANCMLNGIGEASAGATSDRWHVRGHTNKSVRDIYLPIVNAHITALTPHWDKLWWEPFSSDCGIWPVGLLPGHVVPEDFFEDGQLISGFVAARDRITAAWYESGEHDVIFIMNFGNVEEIEQCNEQDDPASDGAVYYIG